MRSHRRSIWKQQFIQNWLGLEGRGHEVYYGVVENIPNVNQVIILWGPVFSVVTGRALRDDTKKRLCSRLRPLDYELSPFFLRDSRASERRARVKSCLSRVGWFWRALAFRSLFYPWGKMGTTRSLYVHNTSTRIRIFFESAASPSGYGFRPHTSVEPGIWIGIFLNPLFRVEIFEYAINQESWGR